jgi:hypothetical protein
VLIRACEESSDKVLKANFNMYVEEHCISHMQHMVVYADLHVKSYMWSFFNYTMYFKSE